jgi:hypothetical protein
VRQVLREKVETLERLHTAEKRNRAILQAVDRKLAVPPEPLTKTEIEKLLGL